MKFSKCRSRLLTRRGKTSGNLRDSTFASCATSLARSTRGRGGSSVALRTATSRPSPTLLRMPLGTLGGDLPLGAVVPRQPRPSTDLVLSDTPDNRPTRDCLPSMTMFLLRTSGEQGQARGQPTLKFLSQTRSLSTRCPSSHLRPETTVQSLDHYLLNRLVRDQQFGRWVDRRTLRRTPITFTTPFLGMNGIWPDSRLRGCISDCLLAKCIILCIYSCNLAIKFERNYRFDYLS